MKTYCVVKDDKPYEGTKEEIIYNLCEKFYFDMEGKLHYQIPGYKAEVCPHTWSDQYTPVERLEDAIKYVFCELHNYGYRTYIIPTWNYS